jgi:hypothetical protein
MLIVILFIYDILLFVKAPFKRHPGTTILNYNFLSVTIGPIFMIFIPCFAIYK